MTGEANPWLWEGIGKRTRLPRGAEPQAASQRKINQVTRSRVEGQPMGGDGYDGQVDLTGNVVPRRSGLSESPLLGAEPILPW